MELACDGLTFLQDLRAGVSRSPEKASCSISAGNRSMVSRSAKRPPLKWRMSSAPKGSPVAIDRNRAARNWVKVLDEGAKGHRDATFIFGHAKAATPVTGSVKVTRIWLRERTVTLAGGSMLATAGGTLSGVV